MRSTSAIATSLMLVILVSGCGKQPGVQKAADESLATDAYMAKGMPPPDRPWQPLDYEAAVKTLQGLDPSQLPRWQSPNSGAVYQRMVATENLDILSNRTLPAEQRIGLVMGFMQGSKSLAMVYIQGHTKLKAYDHETLDMMLLMFQVARKTFVLVDEFAATLPADDPKAEVRKQGREQMRKGFAQMVDAP